MSTDATVNDWLIERPAKPVAEPAAIPLPATVELTELEPKPPGPNWLTILLACAVTFLIVRDFRPDIIPTPKPDDDSIVVDIEGTHALLLLDDDRSDQLTAGQAAAANWSGVLDFAKSNAIKWRRYDAKDDLATVEPEFQALRKAAADPPSLTIARDKRVTTGPVPDGIEPLKAKLAPP